MIERLQQAISLTKQGRYNEAEDLYIQLTKDFPDNDTIWAAFGLYYVSIKDFEKASVILHKACSIKETLGTLSALGLAEFEKRNWSEAAEILEKSLAYGQSPDIFDKLIYCLFETKHYQKAVELADKMYETYPQDLRAITNKVKSLTQSGKIMQAEKFCKDELLKNPQSSSLWFHYGFLQELIYCDDYKARECFKAASELGNPEAYYNIAVSCQKLGEYDEAEKNYKKMLEYYPDNIETRTSLGMCLLAQKKFNEGYDLFFEREDIKYKKLSKNLWHKGLAIDNDVVIVCEQGYGDHIQFIRYLPYLGARNVYVAAPPALVKLFSVNYPSIKFIDYTDISPDMQSIRVTDLAYALELDFNHIPFAEGYLKSEVRDISNRKLKVGLCWEAGSAAIRNMINRTIHVKLFEPLFDMKNLQVYSFQYNDTLGGNEKYNMMINLAKDFRDFSDTAAALMAMDVVVTVDTSVAHLAGALGVTTYLLLPYSADWRWFNDDKSTPWYNSIEIFKQTEHISWEKPLSEIFTKLS